MCCLFLLLPVVPYASCGGIFAGRKMGHQFLSACYSWVVQVWGIRGACKWPLARLQKGHVFEHRVILGSLRMRTESGPSKLLGAVSVVDPHSTVTWCRIGIPSRSSCWVWWSNRLFNQASGPQAILLFHLFSVVLSTILCLIYIAPSIVRSGFSACNYFRLFCLLLYDIVSGRTVGLFINSGADHLLPTSKWSGQWIFIFPLASQLFFCLTLYLNLACVSHPTWKIRFSRSFPPWLAPSPSSDTSC